jgi:hypothetical protein
LSARISIARNELNEAAPMELEYEQQQLNAAIAEYATWLLDQNRATDAATLLNTVASSERRTEQFARLDLLLAVQQSRLSALLDEFRADPDDSPSLRVVSDVANVLRLRHDYADTRILSEFVFARKLALQQLGDADFLALAQARLDTDDLSGALDVLRRFTRRGDFYANLDAAASLLQRTHHATEALSFLAPLASGSRWDANVQLRLAAAQVAAHQPEAAATLTAVASSAQAPYATRALAAWELHTAGATGYFDSAELTQLASGTPTEQPQFVYASIVAAQKAAPAKAVPMLRSAILAAPDALSDFIRLRLFQADFALDHCEAAQVAIEPVLTSHPSLRLVESVEQRDDSASNDDAAESSTPAIDASAAQSSVDPFTLHAVLPDETARRTFLLALADVDRKCGQEGIAVEDLNAALDTHPPASQAGQIKARIHALQNAIDLANENAARRPVIQPSVVQSVVVRPRLTALPEVHP